jgi:hypothetical protein
MRLQLLPSDDFDLLDALDLLVTHRADGTSHLTMHWRSAVELVDDLDELEAIYRPPLLHAMLLTIDL